MRERKSVMNLVLTEQEKEFVERISYALCMSAGGYARKKMLPRSWAKRLLELKDSQPKVLKRPGRPKRGSK